MDSPLFKKYYMGIHQVFCEKLTVGYFSNLNI